MSEETWNTYKFLRSESGLSWNKFLLSLIPKKYGNKKNYKRN